MYIFTISLLQYFFFLLSKEQKEYKNLEYQIDAVID